MINWKKDRKTFGNKSYFDKVVLLRDSMIEELIALNKRHKLFKAMFATKKYWKAAMTEKILLALNELYKLEK